MTKKEETNEDLNKSIDMLIDELFVEDGVEKSIDIAGDSKTLSDAVVNQAPKGQNDDARGAGRPKQISDVPENDEDGKREGAYDASISEQGKEQDQPEASQVKESNQIKAKGGNDSKAPKASPFKKSISDEEYEEYQTLKKAKADSEVEDLKKAKAQETEDLIKSVVEKTAVRYEAKVEELTKSLDEQKELVKSFAKRPKQSKSITNLEAVEKSLDIDGTPKQEAFTKSEMLDVAFDLAINKSVPEFNDSHAIELENNGYVYDPNARQILEKHLQNKK